MTYSAVSWAYKDVVTSAKLAQMQENIRSHDHFTTDQGQRLGVLARGNLTGTFAVVSTTAPGALVTGYTFSVTIPTGLTSGRSLVILGTFGKAVAASTRLVAAWTRGGTAMTDPTTAQSFDSDNVGSTTMAFGPYVDLNPPSGAQTYQLYAYKIGAGVANVMSASYLALIL